MWIYICIMVMKILQNSHVKNNWSSWHMSGSCHVNFAECSWMLWNGHLYFLIHNGHVDFAFNGLEIFCRIVVQIIRRLRTSMDGFTFGRTPPPLPPPNKTPLTFCAVRGQRKKRQKKKRAQWKQISLRVSVKQQQQQNTLTRVESSSLSVCVRKVAGTYNLANGPNTTDRRAKTLYLFTPLSSMVSESSETARRLFFFRTIRDKCEEAGCPAVEVGPPLPFSLPPPLPSPRDESSPWIFQSVPGSDDRFLTISEAGKSGVGHMHGEFVLVIEVWVFIYF
jgi:hypothetical protein